MLTSVVVDRRVLDAFKRRALKHYPKEYMEDCWGSVRRGAAYINAIVHNPGEVSKQTRTEIHIEDDQPPEKQCIGTIHTHSNGNHEASLEDVIGSHEDAEKLFGVCSIVLKGQRRFVTWKFYDQQGHPLELTIGE